MATDLTGMTKAQLGTLADEKGVTLKNRSKMTRAEMISKIAAAVNAAGGNKASRIRHAVKALFDQVGVDAVTFGEFLTTVLAVAPAWSKADDAEVAGKHFSWYKTTYRKNFGQLLRPRKAKATGTEG